jgi:hypothetical protein
MATFVNDLRLKEITTGDEDGTWGTTTNTNLSLIADAFSLGTKQMAANADETFTMPDATADGTRSLYLKITSAVSLTATRTVTLAPNTVSKVWIIENATTGSQIITIAQGSGATINVPNGNKVVIVTDGAGSGAAVFNANPTTLTNANLTGAVTSVGNATSLGSFTSANLAGALTDETGSGAAVFATSPTLVTPALGTPASGVLTNATGLPISTGVSGLGSGVATFLATPSSANLAAAVTNETGSGALVFATSPTLVTPALGTPSALVGTNITGTAAGLTAGNVTTNANLTGAITSTGNATSLGSFTSANLAGALTDETGSGAAVFATSPTLVTPALGTPSSATLTNATGLPIVAGTTGTLSVARGGTGQTSYTNGQLLIGNTTGNTLAKATLTAGTGITVTNGAGAVTIAATNNGTVTSVGGTGTVNGITLTGTVTSSGNLTLGGTLSNVSLTTQVTGTLPVANGGTGITSLGAGVATFLGTPTSANLAAAVTNETGSGALVFATSPTLVTPALGTPSSGTLTNATGLPIVAGTTGTLSVARGGTGITSFGSGVATWLGTPSSANLAAAVTGETGSGALVFATSPTLVTPVLGTPTSGTLSGCTVDGTNAVGFRTIPQNSQSGAYTLVLADSGKHILHPSADTTARTFTIPANSSVAFPIGTALTFINQNGAGVVTIAITTDTMRLSPDGSTGSRTLAANGSATAIKVTATEWLISGSGLT